MVTVEEQNIRGLNVDKFARGFADRVYVFKAFCAVSTMDGDSVRWYQRTAGHLTATSPSQVKVSPLAVPVTLEVSNTRNTSYPGKYIVESRISIEDIRSADLNILKQTIEAVTFAVIKQVDTDIWNVISESQSATNLNSTTTTSVGGDQWDAASEAGDPPQDVADALRQIEENDYDTSNAVLFVNPADKLAIMDWVYAKGAQAPSVGENIVMNMTLTKFAGCKVISSNNVTADFALVGIPQKTATFKQYLPLTSVVKQEEGLFSLIRVWEHGIAILTDPKSGTLIDDTVT